MQHALHTNYTSKRFYCEYRSHTDDREARVRSRVSIERYEEKDRKEKYARKKKRKKKKTSNSDSLILQIFDKDKS